jgi:hypothetical protein
MRRTRHVLAAVVVATALCADRAVAAAPSQVQRPQVSLARSIADRLTGSFRRVVPVVRFVPSRREGTEPVLPRRVVARETGTIVHASELSPFRFRLPPPVR